MSTHNGKLLESKINKIHKEKTINIICKDFDGNIIFVENIKYKKSFKKAEDILSVLADNERIKPTFPFIDYDNSTKAKYIVSKAEKNRNIINWEIDFEKIAMDEIFSVTKKDSINVVLVETPGDMGGTVGGICNGIIAEILKSLLKKLIIVIKIKHNPYKALINSLEIPVEKGFIKRVICLKTSWPVGFITCKNIDNKLLIEKEIMKKLGYKKEGDKWLEEGRTYKYPHEFLD
ncbi:MAG: hypothetical protein IJH34_15435 [Romboutsia sp.]|nr:hypothetical protein [Romboutsia sp.]